MATIKVVESKRKKKRDLRDSLGDDLLRYIAELITNSDDSYRRMESANLIPLEEEKVIYIELKQDRRSESNDMIIVTDNAEGLSKDKLEQIFGTYGADNAGGVDSHARGIFGQGASDVLRSASSEKKTAKIESFKDGHFSRLKYMVDEDLNPSIDVEEIQIRSSQINGFRQNIRIPNNGTCISFGIPSSVKYKKNTKDKLKDMLETFPSFRYLLNQENRKIILIIDGEEHILSSKDYAFDKMTYLTEKNFIYNFKGTPLNCSLKMYKNENKAIDGTNIIVVDENKTVFDNTMFDFGNMVSAKNISGELTILNFYNVCYENLNDEDNPNAIVKDNRTGFDNKNPFYIGLNKVISPLIDSILKEHGDKVKNTDLTNNKKFSDALKKLNKYIKNELKDTISGGNLGGQEPPTEGIKFVRPHASLTKGKTYDLKLLINSQLISSDDSIRINVEDNSEIEVTPDSVSYASEDVKDNGLVVKNVIIKANEITNEPISIEATVKGYKSIVLISVIEAEIHDPENGFEFYQSELTLKVDETHKANLFFDITKVPLGTKVKLTTDGLELIESEIELVSEMLLDDTIGCAVVKSKGGVIGNDYKITANALDLEASVKITIIEKSNNDNSGGGLISKITLQANESLFFQAYFQPHTHEIIINTKNPVNIALMGSMEDKDPNNPKFTKDQTRYLCDIIAQQAAQLLVKTDNAQKGEIQTDNVQEAIDEFMGLIQQHKNKMFMDIYPAMINLSDKD